MMIMRGFIQYLEVRSWKGSQSANKRVLPPYPLVTVTHTVIILRSCYILVDMIQLPDRPCNGANSPLLASILSLKFFLQCDNVYS
jgi:hypothetical protein